MLLLSWASNAPSYLSHLKIFLMFEKGSPIFFFLFLFLRLLVMLMGWGNKSYFIRFQQPKVRPDSFSSCCICQELFLGSDGWHHIQAGGFLNVLESIGKPQCCYPVPLESLQCPSTAFLLLSLLPPGGKVAIIHSC